MSIVGRTINGVLRPFGLRVGSRTRLDADERLARASRSLLSRLDLDERALFAPARGDPRLPAGAVDALRADHPRLAELRERYHRFDAPVTRHTAWNADFVAHEVDLRAFRGDVAYVWQARDFNAAPHYVATACYAREIDRRGLLAQLGEDDLFGARTYRLGDSLTLSRDLLDSVLELNFLDRHTDLFTREDVRMLDIGAGYGRFAHRAVRALPNLTEVLCTDAIAESTFLCEYYLRFRGVDQVAHTIPLDEIGARLAATHVDFATNIHSFSEMPFEAITWWLDLVAAREVPWLLVVPNPMDNGGDALVSEEADGSRRDFLPGILAHGYRLAVKEPKHLDPLIQRHGVTPTCYWLFRRT